MFIQTRISDTGLQQVNKFLDKNYDQVGQDVLDIFIQSKNKVGGTRKQRSGSKTVRTYNISQYRIPLLQTANLEFLIIYL